MQKGNMDSFYSRNDEINFTIVRLWNYEKIY